MKTFTPSKTSNSADSAHMANTYHDLVPDDLDPSNAEVINNAKVAAIGHAENLATLDIIDDKTQYTLVDEFITACNANNDDQVSYIFPDGGLDDSIIVELKKIEDPPVAQQLSTNGTANTINPIGTLSSIFGTLHNIAAAHNATNSPVSLRKRPLPLVSYAHIFDLPWTILRMRQAT
jgi:hypothetical protein